MSFERMLLGVATVCVALATTGCALKLNDDPPAITPVGDVMGASGPPHQEVFAWQQVNRDCDEPCVTADAIVGRIANVAADGITLGSAVALYESPQNIKELRLDSASAGGNLLGWLEARPPDPSGHTDPTATPLIKLRILNALLHEEASFDVLPADTTMRHASYDLAARSEWQAVVVWPALRPDGSDALGVRPIDLAGRSMAAPVYVDHGHGASYPRVAPASSDYLVVYINDARHVRGLVMNAGHGVRWPLDITTPVPGGATEYSRVAVTALPGRDAWFVCYQSRAGRIFGRTVDAATGAMGDAIELTFRWDPVGMSGKPLYVAAEGGVERTRLAVLYASSEAVVGSTPKVKLQIKRLTLDAAGHLDVENAAEVSPLDDAKSAESGSLFPAGSLFVIPSGEARFEAFGLSEESHNVYRRFWAVD